MFYDFSILWFWLVLAAALGGYVGWRHETDGIQEPWRYGWFKNSLIALGVVVFLSLLHVPGGRLGFWLESAAWFYVAYLLGCLGGGQYRRREAALAAESAAAPPAAASPAPAPRPAAAAPKPAVAPAPTAKAAPPSVPVAQDPPKIAKVEGEEKHEGHRPVGFVSPRAGKADDLQRIKGIGRQNEERLHSLGIWHFSQIAAWTTDNIQWVGSYLSFSGRIEREQWIAQATALAAGGGQP